MKTKSLDNNPAGYPYCLTDVDGKDYGDTLDALFRDPNFTKKMQSRQNLYNALSRMPTQQRVNQSLQQIERMDENIGWLILQAMVMRSLQVNHLTEYSFNDLLKDVDLSDEKKKQANERMKLSLDMVTFLTDVLESKLTDINTDLQTLFGKDVEFKQLDGVMAALRNMAAFFAKTRDEGSQEAQTLFAEYADSIENYLNKRMETFIKKYQAIKAKDNNKNK